MPDTHPRGFFKDVGHWIKKHPLAAAILGVVIGVLVYLVITQSQAQTGQSQGLGTLAQGTDNNPVHVVVDNPPSSTPTSSSPPSGPGTIIPPILPPTKPGKHKKPPKFDGGPIKKPKPQRPVTTHTHPHNPRNQGYEPTHQTRGRINIVPVYSKVNTKQGAHPR